MSHPMSSLVEQLHDAVPYAKFLNVGITQDEQGWVFVLPESADNIGNPVLPAIHGGVIAGFLELSASIELLLQDRARPIPKVIDFSLDYLRAAHLEDTFARCEVLRQGNRVVNVGVRAWQSDPKRPICSARVHFLWEQAPS